jgi:hypothetical protein
MFFQNFFSWPYFGNLLCFSSYPHHSTIPQPNNFIRDCRIRLLGQKRMFTDKTSVFDLEVFSKNFFYTYISVLHKIFVVFLKVENSFSMFKALYMYVLQRKVHFFLHFKSSTSSSSSIFACLFYVCYTIFLFCFFDLYNPHVY